MYFFVCSLLKHQLNTDTDILDENGTGISNAVSVSSRKCSINIVSVLPNINLKRNLKNLLNSLDFVLFNIRGKKIIVKL